MGIVLAIITALGPALPAIIQGVEQIFGPKTGTAKLEAASAAAGAITSQAATAGKLPGLPTEADVKNAVETVVQVLKSQGALGAPAVPLTGGTYTFTGTIQAQVK